MILSVKNNNPLNLRSSVNKWKGEVTSSNDEFEVFESWVFGLRAGMKNMKTQIERGNDTIAKLVNVWAPPTENETENYIRYVCEKSGIDRDTKISFSLPFIQPITNAMVKMESGQDLKADDFLSAWGLI